MCDSVKGSPGSELFHRTYVRINEHEKMYVAAMRMQMRCCCSSGSVNPIIVKSMMTITYYA